MPPTHNVTLPMQPHTKSTPASFFNAKQINQVELHICRFAVCFTCRTEPLTQQDESDYFRRWNLEIDNWLIAESSVEIDIWMVEKDFKNIGPRTEGDWYLELCLRQKISWASNTLHLRYNMHFLCLIIWSSKPPQLNSLINQIKPSRVFLIIELFTAPIQLIEISLSLSISLHSMQLVRQLEHNIIFLKLWYYQKQTAHYILQHCLERGHKNNIAGVHFSTLVTL